MPTNNWLPASMSVLVIAVIGRAASAAQQGDAPDSIRADDAALTKATGEGGIAGVGYAENFESGFVIGFGCNQSGWTCVGPGDFEIIDFNPPEATFGNFSAMDQANGSNTAVNGEMLSPLFPQGTGVTYADIVITNNGSLYQWVPWSQYAGNTANFFNTRINFEANGTITALQIDTNIPPNCAAGTVASFHATSGTWAANVKTRIGVEINAGGGMGSLKIHKDGVVIFTGHDISQECSPANPVGISRLRSFNSNIGTTTKLIVDNISSTAVVNPCAFPLPLCRADVDPVGGNGVVNIQDLLKVIATWGQVQNPPGTGPRPQGDCAPLPNGDCAVNVSDLLAVVTQWGVCPQPTGACCALAVCSILTEAACTGPPTLGTYLGNFSTCSGVVCPTPPANDMCENAMLFGAGAFWNNIGANFDGPPVPIACLNSGTGGRQDVWLRYYTDCANHLIVFNVGAQAPFTDTIMQVFRGWDCDPLGEMIACNDDGYNLHSNISIPGIESPFLLIRIMSKHPSPPTNQGSGSIGVVTFDQFFGGCQGANPTLIGQVKNAFLQSPNGEHCITTDCLAPGELPDYGSWFQVTGNGRMLTASTCGSPANTGWDAHMAVFCGSNCFDLKCIAQSSTFDCGPSGEPGTGTHERMTWCSQAGRKYFIFVGSHTFPPPPATSAFQLVVTEGPSCQDALPCGLSTMNNDHCADAIPISDGTTSFNTTFASTDGTPNTSPPPGIDCQDSGGTQTVKDIWFRYTATSTGVLTVTTCSNLGGETNFDSDLVLYPGNATCPPASSQIVACNDDDFGNPCGAAPPWASTLRANVTSGQSYLLRVGGYNIAGIDFGTGILNITCESAECGNGIIEGFEDCDDQNANPNDGCHNCVAQPLCSAACTYNSIEACAQVNPDNVNGGCNSTPEAYEFVPLTSGTAVICGNLWAGAVGTSNFRDTDWYKVTVGDAGVIQANIISPSTLPMTVQLLTTNCALLNPLSPAVIVVQNQCGLVKAIGLVPGSEVIVFVSTANVFTGFPCPVPFNYSVRVVSP